MFTHFEMTSYNIEFKLSSSYTIYTIYIGSREKRQKAGTEDRRPALEAGPENRKQERGDILLALS